MATLKPHSNGPLYSNSVIGTLAVDGWAGAPPSPLLAVPNVTAHPSTANVPTSCYLMWHYNCRWTLKGCDLRVNETVSTDQAEECFEVFVF